MNAPLFVVAGATEEASAEQLGVELRRLRAERKLTIAQLADKAGLSSGLISQIERGKANPSIKTLQRLRAALGVNLWEFLEGSRTYRDQGLPAPSESQYVRRKTERPRIVVGASRLTKELLSPRSDRNLRFMMITLPPGGVTEDVIIGEGEKGGLVMAGTIELSVGSEVFEVSEGDSFQFPSHLPHNICNLTQKPATVLWIMSVLDSHI